MNRRGFLGSILATGTAPVIVRAASLMPIVVPKIIAPSGELIVATFERMSVIKTTQPGFSTFIEPESIKGWSRMLSEDLQRKSSLWGLIKE